MWLRKRRGAPRLAFSQAIALGLLHGPAELLPISSSAHTAVVPWLLDWSYSGLDSETRKSFEVALHAGTAAGLLIALRDEVSEAARDLELRTALAIAVSAAPAGVAGYLLERPIEERLGTPPTIAAGLTAGSLLMLIADRAPRTRGNGQAGLTDAIWLGLAQAAALLPGVSRTGATTAAARLRGFDRGEAGLLSRHLALPVLAGAAALKTSRLLRSRPAPESAGALGAGAAAAFASTLASARLIRRWHGDGALTLFAIYRMTLAAAILGRLRAGGKLRRGSRARHPGQARG